MGDLIIRLVTRFKPQVIVFKVDIEVRQDELLSDLLPDYAAHVSCQLSSGRSGSQFLSKLAESSHLRPFQQLGFAL